MLIRFSVLLATRQLLEAECVGNSGPENRRRQQKGVRLYTFKGFIAKSRS